MSKRAKKTAKRNTHKSLGSAMRAVKRKGKAAARAPAMPMFKPNGFALRPIDTRWPKEIKVGKRHRTDFGDLKGDARSIDERGGMLQPIAITPENVLIAGERRMKMWPLTRFKNDPIPVRVVSVDSILAGEWDENAHRKDFTPSESVSIKREMEKVLAAYAAERKRAGKAADPRLKGRAGDQAAKFTGHARRTIEKADAVVAALEKNPKDKRLAKLKADMDRTGKVNGPFKRLQIMQQTEALRKAPPPLPMRGPYTALVIDYPWPGEKDAEQADIDKRGRSFRDYPEMAIDEGCKLFRSKEFQALLAPNMRVYFWTTNHHADDAFVLLRAMGFDKHSTIGTWTKNKMGRGQVLRGKTEQCILAERGKPVTNVTDSQGHALTTDWSGEGWDVREDSRKPDAFYALVEEHTPAPRYAEIFSRGGRNEKWDCHGDQAGKFAPSVSKEQQAEILAPIAKSYDELKLATLEAIERGETPDLRLLDKKLVAEFDQLVEGKKKLKLSRSGERALAKIREDADYARLLAELPNDAAPLEEEYRKAIVDQHILLTASKSLDLAAAQGMARRIDVILNKVENGGKDRLYGRLSWSKKVEKLTRGFAAPVGQVPMWGQAGLFQVDVDGLPVLVLADHDGEFKVFALDAGKPFLDESGSDYLSNVTLDTEWGDHKEIFGKTVDQHVLEELRSDIKRRTPPKKGKPKPHQRLLDLPEKVYALPAEWDGKSEPRPVKAKAPGKPGKPTPPPKAPAKTVRRTLPKRDAALIEFAETKGHVVSMTNDQLNRPEGESVATCACGWTHREPLHGKPGEGGNDPVLVKTRMASHRAMDDAVTKHWREQMENQPTADGPAAGSDEGSKVAAAAAPLAGSPDDGQLGIPGFLDRRQDKPAEAAE